jgi:hypothetical protein
MWIYRSVVIWIVVAVLGLLLLGVKPYSRLYWKRYFTRKQHREIMRLTKGVPDEDLPEHIRREKVLIEGEYNQKIAKIDDKKFLF